MRRLAIIGSGLLLLAALLFLALAPAIVERSMNGIDGGVWRVTPQARALHAQLVIADLHADSLMWKRDLLARSTRGHVDLPRLRDGHVALQVFSSVTKSPRGLNLDSNPSDSDQITLLAITQLQPPSTWGSLAERSLYHARKLRHAAQDSQGRLRIIRTAGELRQLLADRARGTDATGALLSIEGLHNLEGRIETLARFDRAGFRMAGLAHFFDNEVAGSLHGEEKYGLTPFGRAVVAEMERRRMIVDLAHSSHKTIADVLKIATRPVVYSHGGVRATCDSPRNLTDAEVRGIAASGGVIGIGYWDAAVCEASPQAVARAIRHVRDLVGIDHVALGSDFDGAVTTGFDTAGLAAVTQALIDQGFSEAEIRAVMGGNVVRLLDRQLPR